MSRDANGGGTDLGIRRYEPGDEDAVWDLHVRALSATGAYDEAFAHLDADLRRIESAYLEAGGEFLVGERSRRDERRSDGESETELELVAMGGFQPIDALEDGPWADATVESRETAVLRRMRVDPDHQRRGFGTAILRELESRARARGFDHVVLDTTTRQDAAVAFYEDHGYDPFRRETIDLEERDETAPDEDDTLEMLFYEKSLDDRS